MIKKLLLIVTMGVTLSGCFMVPLAMVGPAVSGFSTASLIQTGVSSGVNYMIKQSSGKSISEHAISIINNDALKQSYFPEKKIQISSTPF